MPTPRGFGDRMATGNDALAADSASFRASSSLSIAKIPPMVPLYSTAGSTFQPSGTILKVGRLVGLLELLTPFPLPLFLPS